MFPLPSTVANSLPYVTPLETVPTLAQAPRMPLVFAAVVVMFPEAGRPKTTTPPTVRASPPSDTFADPLVPLLALISAGDGPSVVPLKPCELVVLLLPVIFSHANGATAESPNVSAEVDGTMSLSGDAARVKSSARVPLLTAVGPL